MLVLPFMYFVAEHIQISAPRAKGLWKKTTDIFTSTEKPSEKHHSTLLHLSWHLSSASVIPDESVSALLCETPQSFDCLRSWVCPYRFFYQRSYKLEVPWRHWFNVFIFYELCKCHQQWGLAVSLWRVNDILGKSLECLRISVSPLWPTTQLDVTQTSIGSFICWPEVSR